MTHSLRTLLCLIPMSVLLPTLTQADTGLYVGASIGSSHLDEDFGGLELDADASAYRLFGGWQFGDLLGIEGGYHNFGDFTESLEIGGIPARAEFRADGWTLGGTLGLPLNGRASLFGRAGVFFWDADVALDGFSVSVPGDDNPYYGGGARVDITPNLALIGDWTRYELDSVDSDVISIGFQYRFGR